MRNRIAPRSGKHSAATTAKGSKKLHRIAKNCNHASRSGNLLVERKTGGSLVLSTPLIELPIQKWAANGPYFHFDFYFVAKLFHVKHWQYYWGGNNRYRFFSSCTPSRMGSSALMASATALQMKSAASRTLWGRVRPCSKPPTNTAAKMSPVPG